MKNAHCPSCQARQWVKGTIRSSGVIHFRPDSTKFLSFHTADIKVVAMLCSGCGFISMIGDVEKLRLLEVEYQKELVPGSRQDAAESMESR